MDDSERCKILLEDAFNICIYQSFGDFIKMEREKGLLFQNDEPFILTPMDIWNIAVSWFEEKEKNEAKN